MRPTTRLSSFALVFLALASTAAFGQSSQSYMNDVGSTPYGVTIPVENGYINVSNGNLHLEFPMASPPQRGAVGVNERLVYDSRIWMFLPFGSNGSYHWWPKNVTAAGGTDASGGWRLVTGGEIGTRGYGGTTTNRQPCPGNSLGRTTSNVGGGGGGSYDTTTSTHITWTDPGGTLHLFNAVLRDEVDCEGNETTSLSPGGAIDGSGYTVSDDGTGNPLVIDSSGAQVYPTVIDRYGNYLSRDASGNLVDATGRVPVLVSQSGNTTYYDVLAPNGTINNQGTRIRYTVTATPMAVASNFQDWSNSDIHQWCDQCSSQNNINLFVPVTSIQLPDGSQYTFSYDGTGELTSITLPTGGTIAYNYSNIFDSSNTENRWLTSRTLGNNPAMTFTPSVVTACANYGTGCVEQVNLHKPSGDETVYTFNLKNGAWNTAVAAYTGSVGNSQPLVQTSSVNTYTNPCSSNCNGTSYINGSISTNTLSTGAKSQTQSTFDAVTGKPTVVQEWDYVASGQSFGGTPTRETDYTYTGYDVQTVKVLSNGNTAGETDYGYTSTPAATTSGVTGHGTQNAGGPYLQTVSHVLTGGNPSVTTYGMDDTGQVVSTSDPNGNPASTVSYQCANSLPYQTKNPLGQTTQSSYDCNSGAVTAVKDPNDLANNRAGTTYAYESGAGRLQSVSSPDGGQTSYSYPSATEVDTTVLATPSPSIASQDFLDSFGRKYQHVQAGVSSETTYDANGRAYCVTNPHTSSGAGTDGSTCVTAYDGLDRPLTQQQPDATTLGWSYNGATVTSTDETGKQWARTSDAFGHLIKVVEPGGYATTYAYDGLGNIQTINQGGVAGQDAPRVRTFVHDSLGRLTSECHPEGVAGGQTCGNSGPWSMSYTYYPAGNVKTQTDARGVTATLNYDVLSRLQRKTFSDGTPGQYFGYDQTSNWMGQQLNTIGRLSQAQTDPDMRYFGSGSAPACNSLSSATANYNPANGNPTYCQIFAELYSYDAVGRLNRVGTAPPSEAGWAAHETDVTFDLAGNMTSLRYPDGRVVTQSFDGASHLQNVVFDNWNGQHVGYTYASGFTYTPAGAQAEVTMGNGVYMHTPYNNRQQLCQTWVSGPQGFVDKHYMYGDSSQYCANTPGNNGTVSQILDMKNGNRSQGFSYDGLNRLAAFSNGDQTAQQSYSLDAFGNLKQSGTLSFQAGTNAKNQFNTGNFYYDNAGNLTGGDFGHGQTNYLYDGANRMFNGTDYYTYAATGDRVRQDSSTGWIEYQYLNGQVIAEKKADGSWSDYIYANGQKVARADDYDIRIHTSGSTPGNQGAAWNLPTPPGQPYFVKQGDMLVWRQFQRGGAYGGPNLQFGSLQTHRALLDTTGQQVDVWPTQNQWASRTASLDNYAGHTITYYQLVTDDSSPSGNYDIFYADMAIVSTDGTVTPIYFRQTGSTLPNSWNTGQSNLNAVEEVASGAATFPQYVTTYFHGDHLGSTRMLTSAEGWPMSSDTFYPYGQEPAGTTGPNHYQYAGLERDPDSGLDHATFRQYSSTTGRWMSPDPYDGSMDLEDPQTLNRYSYVGNNPLMYTDPSGLQYGTHGDGNPPVSGDCFFCNLGPDIVSALDSLFSLGSHPRFKGATSNRPIVSTMTQPVQGADGTWSMQAVYGYQHAGGNFLFWGLGVFPKGLYYGFTSLETQQMRASPHIQSRRSEYIANGCPGSQSDPFPLDWSTGQAYRKVLDSNGTEFQVGGYIGSVVTQGNTSTFTIVNNETVASLIGASAAGRYFGIGWLSTFGNHSWGPAHDVTQIFQWQEAGLCGR